MMLITYLRIIGPHESRLRCSRDVPWNSIQLPAKPHFRRNTSVKWLKILFGTLAALALLLLALLTVLWLKPPELLRVGANYSAKILCSNVFLAGRDPG